MKYEIKRYNSTLVNPRDLEAGNNIVGTIIYKPNKHILGDVCIEKGDDVFFANLIYRHEETPTQLKDSICEYYGYDYKPEGDTIYTKQKTEELIYSYFKKYFTYLPVFATVVNGTPTISTDPIINGHSPLQTFLSGIIYISDDDAGTYYGLYTPDERKAVLQEEIRVFNAWLNLDVWYVEIYVDSQLYHTEDNFYSYDEAKEFAEAFTQKGVFV